MARFAVIDNGVVVGVLRASTPPTINIPAGRLFVDTEELPDIKGGETYDPATGIFSQPASLIETRLNAVETQLATISKAASVTVTP